MQLIFSRKAIGVEVRDEPTVPRLGELTEAQGDIGVIRHSQEVSDPGVETIAS